MNNNDLICMYLLFVPVCAHSVYCPCNVVHSGWADVGDRMFSLSFPHTSNWRKHQNRFMNKLLRLLYCKMRTHFWIPYKASTE